MTSFFKTFWAALLAFIAAIVVINILAFMFFAGLVATIGSAEDVTVKDNSVLEINLDEVITDAPALSPLDNFDLRSMSSVSANTILEVLQGIESAAIDDRIRGIYIDIKDGGSINLANIEELRAAITRFKESGKFVVAYNEYYDQGRYYLSSVADSVWLNPEGSMIWNGMSASVMFYKGLIDKLGVEVEVLRHGTFKSAVEPYITDKMSPDNRLQMERLVGSTWGTLLGDVAASRGIDSVRLQQYATDLSVALPEDAVRLGFVDGLRYRDQVKESINSLLGAESDDDVNTVSLSGYISATAASPVHISDNLVRVIYAEGSIMGGESSRGTVGSETVAEQLAEAREDEDVKAVVLRVNSPGGSALASEVMWREVELLKAEKPVVVSMGGFAASGGYYISCGADVVLTDRTTITGSIGVFGLIPSFDKALKDKLGVTVDVVRTNPSADMISGFRTMSANEMEYGMKTIERVYSTFVGHVSQGRNMAYDAVDAIGQGRVWTGADALAIGLVDGIGGIGDAITLAADRAGIAADFSVDQPVTPSDPFSMVMQAFSSARTSRIEGELGEAFAHYRTLRTALEETGPQARLPYVITIE